MAACARARSGHAYTSSLLQGKGLARITTGVGRMVYVRERWWLNGLAVGVRVRDPTHNPTLVQRTELRLP
jgi:hypothetical protein